MQASERSTATSLSDVLETHPALAAAWQAAWSAGLFLRDQRPPTLAVETKSTPTDAVSQMDRGAEAMIVDQLLGAYPEDGLLGEEGGERQGSSGRRWVVDPLDGTVNYLYGIPLWGVSIALEEQRATSLGVVVLPEADEAYIASRGHGAWHVSHGTARRLEGSHAAVLAQALVGTGFGYSSERRSAQAAVVQQLIPQVRDVRRSGCAVVDLCWLAEGRIDAHYEFGLNPWDLAAGALICREAGIAVTGDDGAEPGLVIASSPGLSDELTALLVQLGADRMP